MKLPLGFVIALFAVFALITGGLDAQTLPGSLSFTVSGSFSNAVGQSNNALLITDNDLTNGYTPGMDQTDAPAHLKTSGPAGSAAFQWGVPSNSGSSNYPHMSGLWFEPLAAMNIAPDEFFDLGFLYYRNGTVQNGTAATAVDLSINISFSGGLSPLSGTFTSDLLNTPNTSNPISSADIVSLSDWASPVNYFNANGQRYYLELSFRVDQDTMDGTLSTPTEFRVFEGQQGRADILGRFTTTPGIMAIPEPSSLALVFLGAATLFRRKR